MDRLSAMQPFVRLVETGSFSKARASAARRPDIAPIRTFSAALRASNAPSRDGSGMLLARLVGACAYHRMPAIGARQERQAGRHLHCGSPKLSA